MIHICMIIPNKYIDTKTTVIFSIILHDKHVTNSIEMYVMHVHMCLLEKPFSQDRNGLKLLEKQCLPQDFVRLGWVDQWPSRWIWGHAYGGKSVPKIRAHYWLSHVECIACAYTQQRLFMWVIYLFSFYKYQQQQKPSLSCRTGNFANGSS